MTGFITGFADYLNHCGFSVSQGKIDGFLILCKDTDITDISSLLPLMSVFFCTCREECMVLEELFWDYFKNMDIYKDGIKNGKERLHSDYAKRKQELADKYASSKITKEPPAFKKPEQKLLSGSRDILRKVAAGHEDALMSGDAKGLSVADINKIMENITKESREMLFMGKDISQYAKLFQLMKSLKKSLSGYMVTEKETKMQMEAKLQKKLHELEKEYIKKQEELDQLLSKIKDRDFHREKSRGGFHAVITGGSPEFKKGFEELSDREYNKIVEYIKDNAMHFKTRMLRQIYGDCGMTANMEKTIKEACRTGGLPMQVIKNKPKPGKAKLVLMLDISGSCSAASCMLLSFMKILKDVFPEGCRVFVFVNSLYDVSPIMEKENGKSAIRQVLKTVPVRGVYSDYGIPFKTMWEKYRMEITHDTVFIVMGDARNNGRADAS